VNLENDRFQHEAESILEDESLTAGLDDRAARLLNQWGLDCLHSILDTGSLQPTLQTEEQTKPRLQAVRSLMRLVTRWVLDHAHMTPGSRHELSSALREQAALIYGAEERQSHPLAQDLPLPPTAQSAIRQQALVSELRSLLEPQRPSQPRRRS